MQEQDFPQIDAALRVVEKFAGRLPSGDAEGQVCQSVTALRNAFTTKTSIEPAVQRLLRSLFKLTEIHLAGRRRDFQRGAPAVDRLLQAVETDLLPALRRVGFLV